MSVAVHAVVIVLAAALSLGWTALRCIHALHMLQLDSYANDRLWGWLTTHPARRLFDLPVAVLQLVIMTALLAPLPLKHAETLLLGGWCIAGAALLIYRLATSKEAKKPLVYTGRAVRILAVALLLSLILILAGTWFSLSGFPGSPSLPHRHDAAWTLLLTSFVGVQLAPLAVMLANLLLAPVQNTINRTYLRRAEERLGRVRPRVIGITGSYGKTSTKYLLERLLADQYKVLKTPLSYNTLMGVCRVVNEALEADHQIFVVEMGAYRRGDIRELCEFVHPSIGILTAIGPQHLERFKTIENVQATKYELIQALPALGIAIFNNDDPRCRALANRTTRVKVLRYGLDTAGQSLDVWAENVAMGPGGLSFTMHAKGTTSVEVQTALLGRHNALNILGASCAAMALGVGLPDLAKAIRELPPVPHRLQLIRGEGGVTVIDDSYNSNPVGAMEALTVLGSFSTGQRILVTPGMVELGTLQAELNAQLGARAAEVCDYVVLVGLERSKPLLAGLQGKGFAPERISVVADLPAATEVLKGLVHAGDTVLFENDLPDLY